MVDPRTDAGVLAREQLPILLGRDSFFRMMLRELAGTLEEVVGIEDAAGFISVVGQKIGEEIHGQYQLALNQPKLSREQVADVLVDLKRRIGGNFTILEQDDDKIVLGNRVCPFHEMVLGRPSLCMMTSNVFGVLACESTGYAKVSIEKAIAVGDPQCRVVVHLRQNSASQQADGREYFKG